jgi:hypothetical protein
VGTVLLLRPLFTAESAVDRAARLTREHGLKVAFGDPATFYVAPYAARDARIDAVEMEPPDPTSVPPALDGVEESLLLYPAGFVARVARGVFVCGNLKVDGAAAGGTVGPAWIILAAPRSIDDASIRLTALIGVHHELSSLVLTHDPGAIARWTALTPASFGFTDSAAASLAQANAEDPDPSTGFLSAYGATTAENDFNVYAEKMFTEPKTVADLARTHALVAQKAAFVADLYAALDPKIRETFARLGLGAVAKR